IGLVASIFSVAAVGTSVATTLYETADVMINADQQILALAKHVSQFTAVLKHMGQVLKSEKANCSKELLRDIQKIKRSCKRTFKEIDSTFKSKRFRHFVPVRWLFKRTKAMELETRLDSQQSMLQCIIHTLTVSKLGHIDSRSQRDSEHIDDLKVEIKLLKTFIMESYNNLTELRRAEQSTGAEAQYQSISGEPPIEQSPSPTSSASYSDNDDSKSDVKTDRHDADDEVDDANKGKDQNGKEGTGAMSGTSKAEGPMPRLSYQTQSSYNDTSDSVVHHESNLLLEIVPYRPSLPQSIGSGRLISGGQGPDGDTRSAAQQAANSVRLLLDKWTMSGSAPVSDILDEEAAAAEKQEAELTETRRYAGPGYDTYREPLSPRVGFDDDDYGPTYYPGSRGHPSRFHYDPMPPPPLWDNPQPRYGYPPFGTSGTRQKNYWRPPSPFAHLPDRQLGDEILTALRSTRGGIHYTKSSSGTIRREALELLGYLYTETGGGMFRISADLNLADIEELVKLSYQASDRYSREQSKKIIKEREWGEMIDDINRGMPGTYQGQPAAPSQYPPMPGYWNTNDPPYGGFTRPQPYTEYEDILPDPTAPSQAPAPRCRARDSPPIRQRTRPMPISPPVDVGRREHEARQMTRPEVRFTLPRAQLASGIVDASKETKPNSTEPELPTSKTDDELQKARQKLEQLERRREEAENAKNLETASDLRYYAIPDIKEQIEKLRKRQREEQEKRAAAAFQKQEAKESHHTKMETESEDSDDEGGSEVGDLYD
ncbi:MAG: hypothetical protein Q9181_006866, partial [Wetmoreana brouardii]